MFDHELEDDEFRGDTFVINNETKLYEPGKLRDILVIYPAFGKYLMERFMNMIVRTAESFGAKLPGEFT
jgi:hypothetical protein